MVYPHLLYVVRSQIISEQHGFFKGRSIETNLLSFVEFLQHGLDQRIQVDVIYTDFSKAFDKVNVDILITSLAGVGVSGPMLRWFESYLMDRKQFVSVEGYESELFSTTSGVPQGSHLGPLLFIIYINNISLCFRKCKMLLFADDLKIFMQVRNSQDCLDLQRELDSLSSFCDGNGLYLNLTKCRAMSFTRNKNVVNYSYSIGGTVLSRVNVIRDLGVIFDSKLLFDGHVNFVVNSSNRMLGYLTRQCRQFRNQKALIVLYYAYIFGKLNFASVIWNPQYGVYIERLEKVQKRFMRFLGFKCNFQLVQGNSNNYQIRLKHFGILSLVNRRKMSDILFIHKLLDNQLDSNGILQYVSLHVPVKRLRHQDIFHLPFKNTNSAKNSPVYRMLQTCNFYMDDIDIFFDSKNSIKSKLKRIL